MEGKAVGETWGICKGCGLVVTREELAARTEPCCEIAKYRIWVQATPEKDTMLHAEVITADDPDWNFQVPGAGVA